MDLAAQNSLLLNEHHMNTSAPPTLSKVPQVRLIFWIIKILATKLGESGGDAVSMSIFLAPKLQHLHVIYLLLVILFSESDLIHTNSKRN